MKDQNPTTTAYCFAETQVVPEDITCVHAALASADPETLLCVLLESHLAWKMDPRKLTGAAKRHLMKKTTSMLRLMYDIEPVPLSHPDRVIIPVQTFEYPGVGCSITRRVSAAILDVTAWAEGSRETLDYAAAIQASVPPAHAEPWVQGLDPIDVFIAEPWADVLGHAIWLPASLTEYERTSALAHLFWVMAFSGFAEAVHEMRVVNLRRQGVLSDVSQRVVLCFQEQEEKMAAVAALMERNSMVDVQGVAGLLKPSLVA